ncbi:MAG: DUF4186 domain-containing protein [Mailhella sp.]|nr:DUF4186 domain-containing protein [Mailhella sp.]
MNADNILERLKNSPFRARFHLDNAEREYAEKQGMKTLRRHAEDFIRQRLAPASIPNDGRQTPMRGHPVFVAQHACACCCRGCMEKWHHIQKGSELTQAQQAFVVNLLMEWIIREIELKEPEKQRSATKTAKKKKIAQLALPGLE